MLSAVLHELRSALDVQAGAVLVRDELQPGSVHVRECFGFGAATVRRQSSVAFAGTLVERALQEETPVIVETPADGTTPLDAAIFGDAIGSACCLTPLRTGGNVFGALLLVGRNRDRLQEAQPLIHWAAGGIALAVERNRLLAAVAKRDQEMAAIRQVGGALASSTFELDKVLSYTMDMIHEVMNAEAGSLLFLENGELEVAVAFNANLPSLRKFRLKLGQGIAGSVAARGEAVIVNDMERSLQFFPVIDEESGFRTRSALCVPMISQGRVIGVIEVLNKVNGPFDGNDRDLLQALATSVCIALENARLYKETVAAAAHERDVRRMFQKFVPKEVVDKIVHEPGIGDRPAIEEVKRVTLLNIDIRGFSRTSRRMGPQRTVALLNQFFAAMGEVVFRYRGIVDKYLGDGFLAVFGAPVSGPDDADNAVMAALEMRRILADGTAGFLPGQPTAIHMGISLHTGEVVVGNIGFEKKMDYTVIGEAVNTVFRMQGLLKTLPDGILISDTTLQLVQAKLSVTPLNTPAEVQSEFGQLALYELIGSDAPGRRVKTACAPDHGESPLATRFPAGCA
jgi:class 3 adenylate cyclase